MYYLKNTLNWMGGYSEPQTTSSSGDSEIKAPETKPEEGTFGGTLWQIIGKQLGSDVLRIGGTALKSQSNPLVSLPSWMYEPLSSLQRHTEMLEYSEILDRAAKTTDPVERMALVAAFAVTAYSATPVRLSMLFKHSSLTSKGPTFNPILGETYEYIDKKTNMKFFAEQVSHHPPVTAVHVEGNGWSFFQNSSPSTKFLGNSLDLLTQGNTHIKFSNGDHIHYVNPSTRVNNIILGSRWIEHFGDLLIKNMKNHCQVKIVFNKAGLFQGAQYPISGAVFDEKGNKCAEIEGRWDTHVTGKWVADTPNRKTGDVVELWKIPEGNFIENHQYGFTQFAATLNTMDNDMQNTLLVTDSRRRLDRMYLEKGDTDSATKWKRVMEEKQREDRKTRKDTWTPVWFHETEVPAGAVTMICAGDGNASSTSSSSTPVEFPTLKMWTYKGNFWEEREKREKNEPFLPALIVGQACDFTSYEKAATNTSDT